MNQQYPVAWSSYNDEPMPPREHLNTPITSPASTEGQFFSAREEHFGSQANNGPLYANRDPNSGATMYDRASSTISTSLDEEKASPAKRAKKRRCCGNGRYCWCFSKKCCLIFLPILAVILAGIGVTLYYVFPRIPQVEFERVGVARQDDQGNMVEQVLGSASINRDGVVTVPLVIHLNVTNPNYIPWTIHNVTVDGFLANSTQGGSDFPVGTGGLREPFKMPKRTSSNDMPIYFNFRLATDNNNYLPAAESVQKSCTAGGPDLRFKYKAKIILHAISWLGIKPTISDTISFACPISDIESLGINISDLTGLKPQDIAGLNV
ncbi:hypothetical protein LPJ78_002766 [Coemansia sp. RSA 989]|nr:hypothetical protein BX667DRAFT_222831 [Coemansia mojavensis]KAJ1741447.1 hypothetical protein LPJ68_002839 [Coemansia sp. RSA 1086]KAJ1752511.1 hypothetical protein LPJ79_001144 [Coemansia sp. RSA 1821]KAJ1865354.1 hypothetical protein LPJ78_002766 [Coemansia sp. RSA 989]KAJ1874610.1 hypothetical protein LPJ55_001343 [Coemansia sp. RSA 990]KAJ2630608.1 hypothetical protein H4R22_002551 [Coemansia sp. RSA 1290]KAJ2648688.1 hypothetical protein IWW40_003752 [Coemansia sp. RSA 1250]KAJ26711